MGSRRSVVIVAAAVVLTAAVAGAVWTAGYNSFLVREWSGLQQSVAVLDTTIASRSCDFTDINKSAKDLKSRVDAVKMSLSARPVPPTSSRKRYFFIEYLNRTSDLLSAISVNCSTWSAAEITRLEQAAGSMRDSQTACALAIGTTSSKQDIFTSTASIFNKMRQSRKNAAAVQPQVVVIGSGLPANIGFNLPDNSLATNYFVQMRSLLKQYMSLRGDLDAAHVSERARFFGGISETDRQILQNARDSRQSILNQMQVMPVPYGCQSVHDSAIGALSNGIAAVDSLLSGNWDDFHQRSNNGMAARAFRDFGIGG